MTSPRDFIACHGCGKVEHIHLLDGAPPVGGDENSEFSRLLCIECYPDDGWAPCGEEHIGLSIRPELAERYRAAVERLA